MQCRPHEERRRAPESARRQSLTLCSLLHGAKHRQNRYSDKRRMWYSPELLGCSCRRGRETLSHRGGAFWPRDLGTRPDRVGQCAWLSCLIKGPTSLSLPPLVDTRLNHFRIFFPEKQCTARGTLHIGWKKIWSLAREPCTIRRVPVAEEPRTGGKDVARHSKLINRSCALPAAALPSPLPLSALGNRPFAAGAGRPRCLAEAGVAAHRRERRPTAIACMSGSTWPAASRGTCSSSSGDSARTVARKAEAAWRKEAGRPVLWSPGKLTSVFSPPRAADMHLEWCGRTRVSLSAVATSAGIWQAGAASMGRHLYKSNPARFHTEEATCAHIEQ